MLSFDKIVNKMLKRWWKIIFKEDIFEIIDPEKKEKYQAKVDKIIYRLKAERIIIPLKSWVYIIPDAEDDSLNAIDLIEKYYMRLLKKYVTYFVGADYFIGGKKSLELQLKDYSIPEKILIINRKLNKKVKVGDYEIIFKTIGGKEGNKKINLFAKLLSFIDVLKIEEQELKVASLELALLEASVLWAWSEWVDIGLLTRAIKKYGKVLKREDIAFFAKYKYIMSLNRLKEISKNIDGDLYNFFLSLIKENGGLFIGEGLRGF